MSLLRNVITKFKENQNEIILENYKYIHNGKTEYGSSFDLNYWNRKDLIFELLNNYKKTDRPLIKWLIKEELKGFEVDLPIYTIEICAFMLYKHMEVIDVYDLFDAKFGAGSDHQAIIDIELIFGLELGKTKDFLQNEKNNKILNNDILSTIKSYEDNPNAKFKTRDQYIKYFETIKLKNIQEDLLDFENELRE